MSSVVKIPNPKEHFIKYDGLCNVMFDFNYSILKKYNCKAGCRICYIANDFLPSNEFKKHIPIHAGKSMRPYFDKVMEFASYFQMPSTIDDMRYLRDEHPELFSFYQEYGSAFYLSSMTDNALIRHMPIMDEVKFAGVREISFSQEFLDSVKKEMLYKALDKVQSKATISKIKLILYSANDYESNVANLAKWCSDNRISLEKQIQHGLPFNWKNTPLVEIQNARFSKDGLFEEDRTYTEGRSDIYPIHSETVFLQFDDFYSELKSATREDRSAPFAKLDDFIASPRAFLARVIEGKQADYKKYSQWMKDTDNDYYRYFKYVADNLVVNRNFNFLPHLLLQPDCQYYKKLLERDSLVVCKYGLVDPSAETITLPYTFKNEPDLLQN